MLKGTEVARRLYHDLVRGRTAVRIVPAQRETAAVAPPVFLIGVYRSGTTLLRYLVDSHSQFCCPPETDFIVPMLDLIKGRRESRGLAAMGFDEDHVAQQLRESISYFFANYALSVGKPRWADKTPAHIECLPELLRVFPDARFVMLYRFGPDQAHSMTRGGTYTREVFADFCQDGEDLRIGACRYWVQQVQLMLDFQTAHPDSCYMMRYEDLCANGRGVLEQMFEFAGEAFEPEVLEYAAHEHTVGREDGRALAAGAIQAPSSHYKEWPEELQGRCFELCEPLLRQLGYHDPVAE